MLTLILFFIAGAILGIIGLRLLTRWEQNSTSKRPTTSFRHHS
jgi:hypothetical protein